MQHSTGDTDGCSRDAVQVCCSSTPFFGARDKMLVGLILLTLVRSTQALAAEQLPPAADAVHPDVDAALAIIPVSPFTFRVPSTFQASDPAASQVFSSHEFRPHGRSMVEKTAPDPDAPMLRGTTVWQRLSDYRSRDRVRVVTLWETGGGNVSLQAGKKGDPSLQWTSRLMNRGGSTRGLLDQWFAASVSGVARGLHFPGHAAGSDPVGRTTKPPDSCAISTNEADGCAGVR